MPPKPSSAVDVARHLAEIEDRGYTILEGILLPDFADELAEELARVERETQVAPAKNDFEGRDTLRVYNLLVDPGETENVLFPNTWVPRKALLVLEEHVASLRANPPIEVGAPDPYEPSAD